MARILLHPLLYEDAQKIVQTSDNFNDIKAICKFLLDPSIAEILLCCRKKHWLNAFLNHLCRDKCIPVPHCDSKAKPKVILDIVRDPSPSEAWSGYWIFRAQYTSNITSIAAEFDTQIHLTFCTIPFSHWVSYLNGDRNRFILEFLNAMFNFSRLLVQYAGEQDYFKVTLVLLLQALKHPLSRWIVSTAIVSDELPSPTPSTAFEFLFHPIQQLLQMQSSSVLPITQRLLVLEARFNLRIKFTDDPNLDNSALSTDFTLWDNIQKGTLKELARSNTEYVQGLFSLLLQEDVLQNGPSMQDIRKDQSNLCDDVWAYLAADRSYGDYFMRLAELYLELHNMHSARAIGEGLYKVRFQCSRKWSKVWALIDPGNLTECMAFMDKYDCLPCFSPYMAELPQNLGKIFRFANEKAVEVGVEQNIGRGRQAVGQEFEQNIGRSEKAVEEGVEQNIGQEGQVALVNRNSSSHTKHAVGDSDDRNYLYQPTSQQELPTTRQCFALTDEQCRKIKELIDPCHKGLQRDWELNYQPKLIRLYMTTMSFYQIESWMTPMLTWSKSCSDRFRDWLFPVNPIERANKIIQLYALVSRPTPANPTAAAPQGNYEFVPVVPTADGRVKPNNQVVRKNATKRISRDGQPPKPEIHTTRTECNNTSQSFVSAVLNADGRAKPKEMMVSKDAAKYQWWKNESAKTPVRKPIVASTSGKDAVDQPLSLPVHPRPPSSSFSFHVLDIDACAAPETGRPTLPIAPPTNGPQQVEKVSTHNQYYPIEKGLYIKHPKSALTDEEALILARVKKPRLMPKSVSGNQEPYRTRGWPGQDKAEKCTACLRWGLYCDQKKPCGSCVERRYVCYPQGEIRPSRGQNKAEKCGPCQQWRSHCDQEKPRCGSCSTKKRICYSEIRPSCPQDKAEKCAPCLNHGRYCDQKEPRYGKCANQRLKYYPQGETQPPQTALPNLETARPVPSKLFLGTWSNSSDDEDPSTVQHSNEKGLPTNANASKSSSGLAVALLEEVDKLPVSGGEEELNLIYQLHHLPGVDVAAQKKSSRVFEDLFEVPLEVKDFELPFHFHPIPESELPYTRIYENKYTNDVRINIPECLCSCEDICNESCLNRNMLYECNENICSVGTECSNRAFSNLREGLAVNLRVFPTLDCGLGLWSTQDLVEDQFIAEYVGEVITEREFKRRQEAEEHAYIIALGHREADTQNPKQYIDAKYIGNPTSMANNSCVPNCRMGESIVNGRSRLALSALRNIRKCEQLTFAYRGQVGFVGDCRCESCRKTFCKCDDIEYGLMIACDNEDCPYEWFHWGCEGVKEEPVGKWFCSTCRKT